VTAGIWTSVRIFGIPGRASVVMGLNVKSFLLLSNMTENGGLLDYCCGRSKYLKRYN
jgi:hypothetical protein